jgi:glycosyltransferase EpsF
MIHIAVPRVVRIDIGGRFKVVHRISLNFSKDIIYDYIYFFDPVEKIYLDNTNINYFVLSKKRIFFVDKIISYIKLFIFLKRNDYKICYINESNAIFMFMTAFVSYLARVPVRIGHSHSSNADFNGRIKRLIMIFLHHISKYLLHLVITDYFTCSYEATKWMFSDNVIRNNKIIKINNPIDTKIFKYNKAIRDKKRLEMNLENKMVIGHVGRFSLSKNHIFLLRILKEIIKTKQNIVLLLIGEGPLYRNIKDEAYRLGIKDNIIFVGTTSEINEYMQIFDIFVLPSIFEGLPLVGIEAQGSGLPCVFSDIITKEVDITGNCIFLSLHDEPSVWAKKIISYENSFIRKDCSDLVKKNGYDVEDSAENLENIFNELINKLK